MAILFVSFGAKSLSSGGKFVRKISKNQNCAQKDKLFFPNLCKLQNLYILMEFYLVLSKGSLSKVLSTPRPSCEAPFNAECPIFYNHYFNCRPKFALKRRRYATRLTVRTPITTILLISSLIKGITSAHQSGHNCSAHGSIGMVC